MLSYSRFRTIYKSDPWALTFLLCAFVICPFASFLLALTNAKSKASYVIYFLFGILFAWHLNPTGGERYDDIIGIMTRVCQSQYSFDDISTEFIQSATFDQNAPKEWYEHFMIWLSKSFSPNPHLFFALCAIPWLIFELKCVSFITSDPKFKQTLLCMIVLLLFVAPRDIITLQNPRFTTGLWIAIYALIKYFHASKRKVIYLCLICILPLIHSAFWFFILAFILGNIALHYPSRMMLLLYISIPFSYLSYDIINSIDFNSLPLPASLSSWISGYLSEDSYNTFVAHKGASGFWYIQAGFNFLMKTTYLLIPIYLWKYRSEILHRKDVRNLFGFYIYFYALISFIQFIPVLGERFFWMVRILGIYLWFKTIFPRHKWVLQCILLACSYSILTRYFYKGAVSSAVPLDIFYEPLPMLIADFWGTTSPNPISTY